MGFSESKKAYLREICQSYEPEVEKDLEEAIDLDLQKEMANIWGKEIWTRGGLPINRTRSQEYPSWQAH